MIRFAKYIFGFRSAQTLLALFLVVITTVTEAVGLLSILPLLDLLIKEYAISGGSTAGLSDYFLEDLDLSWLSTNFLIASVMIILVLRVGLGLAYSLLHSKLKYDFMEAHRSQLFSAIIRANRLFHLGKNHSELVHASTYLVDSLAEGVGALYRLISAFVLATIGVLISLMISLKLTLIFLFAFAIFALPMIYFDRRTLFLSRRNLEKMTEIYAQLENFFGGLKTIKTMRSIVEVEELYRSASKIHSDAIYALVKNNFIAAAAARVFSLVSFILVLVIAISNDFALLEPVAIGIIFARVLPNLQSVHGNIREYLSQVPNFNAYCALYDGAAELEEPETLPEPDLSPKAHIEFSEVSFQYPGERDSLVLSKVGFSLKAGDRVGIIGPNGAGKTTLADILSGVLVLENGEMIVDGREISPDLSRAWRSNISYITQEEYMFSGTIRDNFLLENPDLTDDDITTCLELAEAYEFVQEMEDGVDTRVGERGLNFSRGQRQKLCLARGLSKNASVVILDEATSAMTPMDEYKVLQNIFSLAPRKTVFVISHRLSALRSMNKFLVVSKASVQLFEGFPGLKKSTDPYVLSLLKTDTVINQ